jgi:tetratricopeptide (TPR) repeat protein
MKSKLSRFIFAFLLLILAALSFHAFAQHTKHKRRNAQTQVPDRGRQVLINQTPNGSALDGRGKLWAVVIGVSSYKNLAPKDQLQFAHRDAEDFAAFLRSPNGGGYPASQLTLLTNQKATLSEIRSALGTVLPRSVQPDDMVVIFFAGHGVVEGETDGYLLAYDSDPQNLYATALQVSDLNRIISDRLNARSVILIADACHSGRLGLTARGARENQALITRFLDEVGRSSKGVFRLLGSRPDQLSYEGTSWGNGHGAFTWYLLEGLRGRADRDNDGFVREGELLDYLTDTVSNATKALQIPTAAGNIDAKLPLAVVGNIPKRKVEEAVNATGRAPERVVPSVSTPQLYSIELYGAPGLEVYVDNSYRGRILRTGMLKIEQLTPGDHDLSVLSPGINPVEKKVTLTKTTTKLQVNGLGSAGGNSPVRNTNVANPPVRNTPVTNSPVRNSSGGAPVGGGSVGHSSTGTGTVRRNPAGSDLAKSRPPVRNSPANGSGGTVGSGSVGRGAVSSPLAAQINQLLDNNKFDGAFNLYQQLVREAPRDPQLAGIEARLSFVLGQFTQGVINFYTESSGSRGRPGMFQEAADAFRKLKLISPNSDPTIDAKIKFCEGKAQIENGQFADAVERLKSSILLDPRAAHSYCALGTAYRNLRQDAAALDSYKRAAELSPSWALPQLLMGALYRDSRNLDKAMEAFQNAARFSPNSPETQEALIYVYILKGEFAQAEQLGEEYSTNFPDSGSAYLLLGHIYELSGKHNKAAKAYDKGLALTSDMSSEQREDFLRRIKKLRKKDKD